MPERYIHAAAWLSKDTKYELHIIGPKPVTAKQLRHLIRFIEIDIEILSEGDAEPRPEAEGNPEAQSQHDGE